jgi:hypothetical protein
LNIEELKSYNEKEKKGEKGDDEEKRVKFWLIESFGQLYNIIGKYLTYHPK